MIVDIRWYFLANVELATTSLSNDQTIIMINEKCKLGLVCPQFSVNLRYIWEWFWKNGKVGNAPILLPIGYSLCCMQLEEKTLRILEKSPIFSKNDICRALGPFFSESLCSFWSKTPLFRLKKISFGLFIHFIKFFNIFSLFLLQPPPYSNYFDFAAKRSSPICSKSLILLSRHIKHSKSLVERVAGVPGGQNIQTNMGSVCH